MNSSWREPWTFHSWGEGGNHEETWGCVADPGTPYGTGNKRVEVLESGRTGCEFQVDHSLALDLRPVFKPRVLYWQQRDVAYLEDCFREWVRSHALRDTCSNSVSVGVLQLCQIGLHGFQVQLSRLGKERVGEQTRLKMRVVPAHLNILFEQGNLKISCVCSLFPSVNLYLGGKHLLFPHRPHFFHAPLVQTFRQAKCDSWGESCLDLILQAP